MLLNSAHCFGLTWRSLPDLQSSLRCWGKTTAWPPSEIPRTNDQWSCSSPTCDSAIYLPLSTRYCNERMVIIMQDMAKRLIYCMVFIVLYLSISIVLLTAWALQKRSWPQQLTLCRRLRSTVYRSTIVYNKRYSSIYLAIYEIYIAPLQGNYSKALPAQARVKIKASRNLWKVVYNLI